MKLAFLHLFLSASLVLGSQLPEDCAIETARLALQSPLEQFQLSLSDQRNRMRTLVESLDRKEAVPNLPARVHAITERNDHLIEQTLALGKFVMATENNEEVRLAFAEALHDLRNLLATSAALKEFKRVTPENRAAFREVLHAAQEGAQKADIILKGILNGSPSACDPTVSVPGR